MTLPNIVAITAALFKSFTHCRTVSTPRSSLSKRTVNVSSCSTYPQIAQGLTDAVNLANNANNVLNNVNGNPFVDQQPWDPVRQALFGSESLSSTQAITNMYTKIASGHDVKVFCNEPTAKPECSISIHATLRSAGFDAYENFVDPAWATPGNLNYDAYKEQTDCGFTVGHNIVVCPKALPSGSRNFQPLSSVEPGPGSQLDCYKSTWGAMFVHELSHVFGMRDWAPDYAYGFTDAAKIATDAAKGTSKGAMPLTNADTFSLFALAVYRCSATDPFLNQFADFEWSSGYGVQIILADEDL